MCFTAFWNGEHSYKSPAYCFLSILFLTSRGSVTRFWHLVLTGETGTGWSSQNCAEFLCRNAYQPLFTAKKLLVLWLCLGTFMGSSQCLVVNTHTDKGSWLMQGHTAPFPQRRGWLWIGLLVSVHQVPNGLTESHHLVLCGQGAAHQPLSISIVINHDHYRRWSPRLSTQGGTSSLPCR